MTETRKITLQFPSLRAFLAEYGERVSSEGMLLRSEVPPAAGSRVEIEVVVAEGMRLLRASGETLWSGAAGGGQQAAAVRFLELDEASQKLIGKIVDQRRREGAQPFELGDVSGPREARLRELTVPAAAPADPPEAPEDAAERVPGGAGDSVFDLAEPPVPPPLDLLSPPAAESAAPPANVGRRQPAPPVPLLADTEPAPFDLGAPPEEAAEPPDAGPALAPGPEAPVDPVASEAADLSDLFGGDEPERAPASGRTEAFPPSFVDEVEAELEAADAVESSYLEVDTGELEVRLGAPVEEPVDESPGPFAEVPVEAEVPAAPPADAMPVPAEPVPEPVPTVLATEPAAATAPTTEPPVAEPGKASPAAEGSGATPSLPQVPPTMEGTSPQVARTLDAEHGPETVELPIVQTPAPAVADEAEAAPSEAPEEPLDEVPSPVVTAPPAATPPRGRPPVLDDNLLSLPELKAEEPVAAPVEPADLPTSAESLRGAAGRSRHLGTWLLMGLLVAALAIAGYFIFGLVRGGGETGPQKVAEQAPPTRAAVPPSTLDEGREAIAAADPGAPVEPAAAPSVVEAPAPSADEPSAAEPAAEEPSAAEPAAEEPPVAEPAAEEPPATGSEPATPLTGLDRITWSESDDATVLALVGDGEIRRQSVEVVPIGGASPRLVIKISGVERAFQPAVLEVGTAHVQRVRTGLHDGAQLHVVVDLAAAGISVRDLSAEGSRLEVHVGPE